MTITYSHMVLIKKNFFLSFFITDSPELSLECVTLASSSRLILQLWVRRELTQVDRLPFIGPSPLPCSNRKLTLTVFMIILASNHCRHSIAPQHILLHSCELRECKRFMKLNHCYVRHLAQHRILEQGDKVCQGQYSLPYLTGA